MGLKHTVIFKNENLTLTHNEIEGFWIYDKSQGMNIALSAKTEQEAFVMALYYYQKRLTKLESEFKILQNKVYNFLNDFSNKDEE